MATSTLPVSSLVSVDLNLTSSAAQAQNLSNLLILGSSGVIDTTQRVRTYTTLGDVETDFGSTAPEYLAADLWFSQSPQPSTLLIGEWAKTAVSGRLVGAILSSTNQLVSSWNAVTSGGFDITVDGGSVQTLIGLNFSSVTNLNGVASIINGSLTGAVITWNASYQTFVVTSESTGASSTISFATSPASGSDISSMLGLRSTDSGSYVAPGLAAESAVSAAVLFDELFGQQWYALFVAGAADADHLAIAAYIEGANTKHAYLVNTQEGGVLTTTDTTNIAYQLKQLDYKHTVTQYSSNSLYAIVSLAARILTTDYTANNTTIALMYKTEPGVIAETINQSQLNAAIANRVNVFVNYDNNTAIIQPGVTASGDFIDTIFGLDWLIIDIQNTTFNQLYTSPTKIPQTDAGNHLILTGITSVLDQSVYNGLVAQGTWTGPGFGTLKTGDFLPRGYYVYAPPIANQNPADRVARKSVTFQIAVTLAGAIQTVSVILNVTR